ncbi:MAG: (4Fe-4S)-binding protein [Myxococcales bacterium]|nr:MAG: (4Fe-4S)-binding protein [Myxococcales bacterium]
MACKTDHTNFTLAVASGKGGTGKTTLAIALALSLARQGEPVTLLDADAEAPNIHLFLKPEFTCKETVSRPVPEVDESRCTGCGVCRDVCAFKAIAVIGDKPLLFPELCAGCGACARFCPEGAIREIDHEVGWVERGAVRGLDFFRGRLKVGEARVTPVIDALRRHTRKKGVTIIDAPPGTSCPVIAASRKADYLILVTEPTPFGVNDLQLAVEMARTLKLPHGVVVNRADMGGREVYDYCRAERIPVLLEIPFDRAFAAAYATGATLLDVRLEYQATLAGLAEELRREARR